MSTSTNSGIYQYGRSLNRGISKYGKGKGKGKGINIDFLIYLTGYFI